MAWLDDVPRDTLSWLLEPADPGARYLALRDLLALPADDPELRAAAAAAHAEGPITAVLDAMQPEGFWEKPGAGYGPKYFSGVWSLLLLAQLGGSAALDGRIARACEYLLEHALAPGGEFSYNGRASGTFDCLQGNLTWSLLALGYDDPRLPAAVDWMARSQTGEGVAPVTDRSAERRYRQAKTGPLFACAANERQSCAWGAVKVMLAFGLWPAERRTPQVQSAIRLGAEYLLAGDVAAAGYPNPSYSPKPSGNWWKFGFPLFYVTDLLQNVEALAGLGYGKDPRLAPALELIRGKADAAGRWPLEYSYARKTWGDWGRKGTPSKWVTLRALKTLRMAAAGDQS